MKHRIRHLPVAALLLALCLPSLLAAQAVIKRQGADTAPFASSIWVGDTLYLAGMLPEAEVPADAPKGTRGSIGGDTRAQTLNVLSSLRRTLRTQGLDLGDVVQLRVYLLGDPAQSGRMDFAGMNAAYLTFFGTADQPNKPVRATVQVAGLAAPGALIEIEAIAVRSGAARPGPSP